MDDKTKILISLLLLPPALGELLSGSSPPVVFFNPIGFLMLVLLYGCGTVLIRELRVRWRLQWSVVFLAIAYGIIEEGLTVKSFFNPGWVDMAELSAYGMYFGVQWPWVLTLTVYHATLSTLIPIAIIDLVWPDYADVSLLKKKGMIFVSCGLLVVTILGIIFSGSVVEQRMVPFYPDHRLLIVSVLIVLGLGFLAYRFGNSILVVDKGRVFPPVIFGVAGFIGQPANTWIAFILAKAKVRDEITIALQLIFIAVVLSFMIFQICHRDCTKRHIVALCFGSVLYWILLTPVHEFGGGNPDPTWGMTAVGIISLVVLLVWRQKVLKRN